MTSEHQKYDWPSSRQRRLYWQNHLDNFGDRLAPLVVQHLTGETPEFSKQIHSHRHLFGIGSMLSRTTALTSVWGTGMLAWQCRPHPKAKYHMVRGPLSYAAVRAAGGKCPPVWGDPGAFVREIFPAAPEETCDWCLIPHFREKPLPEIEGFRILPLVGEPETFCRSLSSARYVLSSSLHGLIAAHAYGLKAAWLKLSNMPKGDDTKFRDYLLSQGLNPEPLRVVSLDSRSLRQLRPHLVEATFDLDAMRQTFPR